MLLPLFLLGCSNRPQEVAQERTLPATQADSTPTLRAGLPTSTPFDPEARATESAGSTPGASFTPLVAPPPATATPIPAQRMDLANDQLAAENFDAAVEHYEAGLLSNELDEDQKQKALLGLGQARLAMGENSAAAEAFSQYLAATATDDLDGMVAQNNDLPVAAAGSEAYFFLADSMVKQGDCHGAIGAFRSYLSANPQMSAYIEPRIADCELARGDSQAAITALEAAVDGGSERLTNVSLRLRLAEAYTQEGDYRSAIQQYDNILDTARTDNTRGKALYMAGFNEMLAGNSQAAFERYREAIFEHPKAYDSFLALTELVEAGQEVDDYQRGLVNYHAQSYQPAIAAFTNYLERNEIHNEDAHLFLAWSLEASGEYESAQAQIEAFIAANTVSSGEGDELVQSTSPSAIAAAQGWIEKAKLQARAGFLTEAVDSYLEYLALFPEGPDGPHAAWWAAAYSEQLGEMALAVERYEMLSMLFPAHEDAPESLFRAGLISYQLGKLEDAFAYWQSAASTYPDRRYGAVSLVWLLRFQPEEDLEVFLSDYSPVLFEDYYSVRSHHILSETMPFERRSDIVLSLSESDRKQTESWLREQMETEGEVDIASLSPDLVNDNRLIRGQKLWSLGLKEEAKRELEDLRLAHSEDPVASYQLALFFRDLGLFRSSILAATSVMHLLGKDAFSTPTFLASLAYPTYYSDLVTKEAETYGFDPLLQFALIRQESLFESFATSSAVAQGLSQVIPDTGAFIAQRLNWPNYKNEDLYRPYVGIAFGAYYLALQIEAFEGDIAAALSAYNGGPGNASRWFSQAGGDIDLYVETVDFAETRQYIERIYTGHTVYNYLYGRAEE